MNLLKAGLYNADEITTVSPQYAEEVKTQEYGCGLDNVLCERVSDFTGILNGIDTDIWNPSKDQFLSADEKYSIFDITGKAKAKETLQKEFGLPLIAEKPLIGMITRLDEQKGIWELFDRKCGYVWNIFREMEVQMVILGSGKQWCEEEIRKLDSKLNDFKAKICFDEKLAHLIEAGSDFYLMPSRFEPCGLNQIYSLAYATLPIVSRRGGLVNTVINYDETKGTGTGFMFNEVTPQAIYDTVGWAVSTWYDRPHHIKSMRNQAMQQNYSWEKSASAYLLIYNEAIKAFKP